MTAESDAVDARILNQTLTRIEVKVSETATLAGNILETVKDLTTEMILHRGQLVDLHSAVQQIKSDQASAARDLKTADKAREDTATALEKQTAENVKKAKDAVEATDRKWTPRMRLYATLGAIAAFVGMIASTAATVYYFTHR